ncbi:MAG TPA: hypothetical protein DIT93_06630 [Pelagibacterium sp.]|uniref:hypothetical protein n=1 Tax=uncultured Pelagibacterium sp. TaxID=1159875 RepID=UPI000ECEA641|nr:hypothetical protein [Pelagibacterium sp.]|tara:strand:- start:7039 stop:7533 length:495 start_codon:yes stop_codon:yes gene_type:complete
MGELLDRDFQRYLLNELAGLYPQSADIKRSFGDQTDNRLLVNLQYLHEHGLVDFKFTEFMSREIQMHSAKVTARGMDFLADDGGLSAILNVVTVKLHDDTIRDLLINRIDQAPGDPTVKAKLIDRIKSLPAEALGKLTMDGLDAAMAKAPDLLSLLGEIIPKAG